MKTYLNHNRMLGMLILLTMLLALLFPTSTALADDPTPPADTPEAVDSPPEEEVDAVETPEAGLPDETETPVQETFGVSFHIHNPVAFGGDQEPAAAVVHS